MSIKTTELTNFTTPTQNTIFLGVDVDATPDVSVKIPYSSLVGGSNTQIQYNLNGRTSGNSNLTWDNTNKRLNSSGYALLNSGIITSSSNTITLSESYNGKFLYLTSNSNITVNTAPMLSVGFSCTVIQANSGIINIRAVSNTTILSYLNFANTSGQYASASIFSPTANTFFLTGNLT